MIMNYYIFFVSFFYMTLTFLQTCKADKNRKPHEYAALPAAPAQFTVVKAKN